MDDVESGYGPVKRLAAIIGALGLLAGGCSARHESEPLLRPVALPDLSNMTESVQKQIREAHGSLTKTLEKRGAAPAEVADAYGTLGRIFLAADQADQAEP